MQPSTLFVTLLPLVGIFPAAALPATESPPKEADNASPYGKYFEEPGDTETLSHYDARFYKGNIPYEEHRLVLVNLVRSYLETCRDEGVETWLAHGTLLGWWWNGKIMPWDYDIDVQMSRPTLDHVAATMNHSEHEYVWDEGDGFKARDGGRKARYLLDVNPHYVDRHFSDNLNIIDGRWVDMANGAFIDITAIDERKPRREPGIWWDKHEHRYDTRDVYPLRRSEFEGVEASVPFDFERVLGIEYGQRGITAQSHAGHRWSTATREWVPETEEL